MGERERGEMPLRSRTLAALAAVLALSAGCATSQAATPNRVLVIGDSLVNFGESTIAEGLRQAGWEAVVDGRPGSSIGQWAEAVAPVVAESRPRVAVVVLGTNDCAPECHNLTEGITKIMTTFEDAGVERVFWLDVQEQATYPDHPEKVNTELYAAARRWPRLSIVDMSGELGGRPELHLEDLVHFNEAGILVLTKLILDTLEEER